MNKLVKLFVATAVLGIAVQTFASKPAPEEAAFSKDWNEMETAVDVLLERD
jgi:hypothetical protein